MALKSSDDEPSKPESRIHWLQLLRQAMSSVASMTAIARKTYQLQSKEKRQTKRGCAVMLSQVSKLYQQKINAMVIKHNYC